jgi:pyruvate carboxylase
MLLALKDNVILGVKTSIGFMLKILCHPEFIKGNTFTNFIDKNMTFEKETNNELLNAAFLGAALHTKNKKKTYSTAKAGEGEIPSPWNTIGRWEIASS